MTPRHLEERGAGVWVARGEVVAAGADEAAFLAREAGRTARLRARICAHPADGDPLQEMIVMLGRGTYIRPHKHLGRAESLLALAGEAEAVFFDDAGEITGVLRLGAPGSGRDFYYRLGAPIYHTLLLRSERFLYHEATTGPFRPETSVGAPWAPAEGDRAAVAAWEATLAAKVGRFQGGRP